MKKRNKIIYILILVGAFTVTSICCIKATQIINYPLETIGPYAKSSINNIESNNIVIHIPVEEERIDANNKNKTGIANKKDVEIKNNNNAVEDEIITNEKIAESILANKKSLNEEILNAETTKNVDIKEDKTNKENIKEIENEIELEEELENNEKVYEHDGVKYVKGELVGSFSLSGYCTCTKCTNGTGITASGKKVRENHTIAADLNILPMGTMIILDNAVGKDGTSYNGVYQVEDRGGGIKNKRIDIYRPTHDLASLVTYYGRCYGDVYIAIPKE